MAHGSSAPSLSNTEGDRKGNPPPRQPPPPPVSICRKEVPTSACSTRVCVCVPVWNGTFSHTCARCRALVPSSGAGGAGGVHEARRCSRHAAKRDSKEDTHMMSLCLNYIGGGFVQQRSRCVSLLGGAALPFVLFRCVLLLLVTLSLENEQAK